MRQKARTSTGNMMILVSVFFAINGVLLLLASSFGALYFEHSRLQNSANEIALAGARKMNENDRIGQMNNMTARSRQLVYCSTETFAQVDASYTHLRHLAEQLAEEARDSARDLDNEHDFLAHYAKVDAEGAMMAKYAEIRTSYPMCLPWLKVEAPTIGHYRSGKIVDVESNVPEMRGFSELATHDTTAGYVKIYPDMKLYKQAINARLPGTDSSLDFKIDSLPAPIADSASASIMSTSTAIAPARAVLADKFRNVGGDEIPSACQVRLKLKVSTTLGATAQSEAQAIGTAAATGGGLPL